MTKVRLIPSLYVLWWIRNSTVVCRGIIFYIRSAWICRLTLTSIKSWLVFFFVFVFFFGLLFNVRATDKVYLREEFR